MAKHIACNDIVPGCKYTADGATEDELLRKVAEHARTAHGVNDVDAQLLAKVKGAIHEHA